jgi:hypothetical protein
MSCRVWNPHARQHAWNFLPSWGMSVMGTLRISVGSGTIMALKQLRATKLPDPARRKTGYTKNLAPA